MSIADMDEEKIPLISPKTSILHFRFFSLPFFHFQWIVECWQFFENSRGGDVVFIFALFIAFRSSSLNSLSISYLHLKLAQSCAENIAYIADICACNLHTHTSHAHTFCAVAAQRRMYGAEFSVKLMRRCTIRSK